VNRKKSQEEVPWLFSVVGEKNRKKQIAQMWFLSKNGIILQETGRKSMF
jgi:hypothetical protein